MNGEPSPLPPSCLCENESQFVKLAQALVDAFLWPGNEWAIPVNVKAACLVHDTLEASCPDLDCE